MSDLLVLISVTVPMFFFINYGAFALMLYAVYSGSESEEGKEAVRIAEKSLFIAKTAMTVEIISLIYAMVLEVV